MAETKSEFDQLQQLIEQFNGLDDDAVANSIITGDIFSLYKAGEEEVIQRIDKIKNQAVKDTAWFRLAKLYYQEKDHINAALEIADRIASADEKSRCLVQLALAALNKEHNLDLADEIIGKAGHDNKGYRDYFEKEKKRILATDKELFREHMTD